MENQVESLKLNVNNIKSYLINSNKQLKAIKVQKKNLLFKIEKQSQISSEENRLENKNLGIGSAFSKIASTVTAPARSMFDNLLEIIGLFSLGILVKELPSIIQKINSFFDSDFVKSVGSVLTTIGTGFQKLGEMVGIFSPQKRKELNQELQSINRDLENDFKSADQADKELSKLDSELTKTQSKSQSSSEQLKQSPSGPAMDGGRGSGSSPSMSTLSTASQQTTPSRTLQPQSFSAGGTVQNNGVKKGYQPKTGSQSGPSKLASRNMDNGFIGFSNSVDQINETVNQDRKNVLAFAKMSDNFREYIGITTATRSGGPPGSGQNQSGQQALRNAGSQYPGQSFSSGASIGPTGDTDGNQTGLDMNLSGGIGTPIYAPFDLIYRDKGTDGMPSVGLDGTSDVLGPAGRGFGYYGAYYFKRGNKEYEVLMGHFKSLPYRGSKDGEVIPQGTLLGYQGASGRTKSDTNGVYPHISLHVNGLGFQASNSLLVQVANQILNAKPSTTTLPKNQQGPVANLGNSGAGNGGRRLNSINNGNQSVVIYAVQPIETFVPFPYPVLSQSSSSSSRSKPKLPAIWRN